MLFVLRLLIFLENLFVIFLPPKFFSILENASSLIKNPNVDPYPTLEWNISLPPNYRTICFEITSPKPIPFVFYSCVS